MFRERFRIERNFKRRIMQKENGDPTIRFNTDISKEGKKRSRKDRSCDRNYFLDWRNGTVACRQAVLTRLRRVTIDRSFRLVSCNIVDGSEFIVTKIEDRRCMCISMCASCEVTNGDNYWSKKFAASINKFYENLYSLTFIQISKSRCHHDIRS